MSTTCVLINSQPLHTFVNCLISEGICISDPWSSLNTPKDLWGSHLTPGAETWVFSSQDTQLDRETGQVQMGNQVKWRIRTPNQNEGNLTKKKFKAQ